MEERLRLGLGHPEPPTPAVTILRSFDGGLDTLPEDMNAITHTDLVPRIIVVDTVEGSYVCDVLVENI